MQAQIAYAKLIGGNSGGDGLPPTARITPTGTSASDPLDFDIQDYSAPVVAPVSVAAPVLKRHRASSPGPATVVAASPTRPSQPQIREPDYLIGIFW